MLSLILSDFNTVKGLKMYRGEHLPLLITQTPHSIKKGSVKRIILGI